ncbi:SctK family type III secretion system sorting platform protein [uncultured Thiohalocapsa sp.]|uniref:SctK family type III secretion system sorting platform protein n=1 Tax=uncultured Thiohalocapsa sp. TaxID=768990 RepID=UPI0025F65E01|nr:SctK family type III secretion system sorting platform protein [uncultured Thiohalocapsa sp.]
MPETARASLAWWRAHYRFNRLACGDMDPSWWPSLRHGHLARRLADCERARRAVSVHLYQQQGLNPDAWHECRDVPACYGLLPPALLQALLRRLGLVLAAPAIIAEIRRPHLEHIRQQLGADFVFARQRVPLLGVTVDMTPPVPHDAQPWPQHALALGYAWARLAWADCDADWHGRVRWKLPAALPAAPGRPDTPPPAWLWPKLLYELDRPWQDFLASHGTSPAPPDLASSAQTTTGRSSTPES